MNIVIDGRPLISKMSGIGVYLSKVLIYILDNDKENRYYLVSNKSINFDNQYENLEIVIYDNGIVPGTIYFELFLAKWLKRRNIIPDIFWGTQHFLPLGLPKNCKKILTIHDLAFLMYPETVDKKNLFMMKLFTKHSIENSDNIICVSNYTKDTMIKKFPKVNEKNVEVIYNGGNLINDNVQPTDFCIKNEYLLYIGNIEPRKNLKVLLDAFDQVSMHTPLKLVICGKFGWKCKNESIRIKSNPKIEYFDYISEENKKMLLENSFALVLPSINEGFGIPVVESMMCDGIAIVANNSSLKEIVELDILKFETYSSDDLSRKLILLYSNPSRYHMAKEYCSKRSKLFSWDLSGEKHMNLLFRLN